MVKEDRAASVILRSVLQCRPCVRAACRMQCYSKKIIIIILLFNCCFALFWLPKSWGAMAVWDSSVVDKSSKVGFVGGLM